MSERRRHSNATCLYTHDSTTTKGQMNDNSTTYAIIFDMDGVLIDTHQAHYESWLVMTEEAGLSFSYEDFRRTFGRTSREIIVHFWGETGLSDADVARMDDAKEVAFRRIIKADFPAMPHARELLKELHEAGFAMAVGSSGPPENVQLVVDQFDARDLFGALVTATDVTEGKPDPQVFQIAAERLGVPPERCVVIEDAVHGVEAAHRAGMTAVGLAADQEAFEALSAADLVVDSLDKLSAEKLRELADRE